MKEISAENREKGTALANDICKNHRREGLYFDEILDQAVEIMRRNYLMFHTMAPEVAIEDLTEIHQQRKKHK